MGHAEIDAMTKRRHRALAIAAIEIPGALPDHRDFAGMVEFFVLHDDPPSPRHCEEPTGRANARPMTGSATKQSRAARGTPGLLRYARNDASLISATITVPVEDSV